MQHGKASADVSYKPPRGARGGVITSGGWCSADDEIRTVEWPSAADLRPLVLHGDFEPAWHVVDR
jgi:hypothetical protein